MKVAIPLFKDRVSPNFSTAPEALLVRTEEGRIYASWTIELSGLSLTERRSRLLDLGIEVLFCGGIDRVTRSWFEKQGIHVEDNRMGNALEMLNGHLNKKNT